MGKLRESCFSRAVVVAILLGSLTVRAQADQAFVCEDGKLIQVARYDLERLKRTNPCVARHFGLSVIEAETVPVAVQLPPLPERRVIPTRVSVSGSQIITGATSSTAYRTGPNFRDVVIINARPGQPRIFHHRF